jgi:hypothetical protein
VSVFSYRIGIVEQKKYSVHNINRFVPWVCVAVAIYRKPQRYKYISSVLICATFGYREDAMACGEYTCRFMLPCVALCCVTVVFPRFRMLVLPCFVLRASNVNSSLLEM